MTAPQRHLRHRIPVKLRHNWKLVTFSTAFLAICWGVFGSGTIHPYVTSTRNVSSDAVTQDISGSKNLFDISTSHQVKLTFRDEAYEDMLTEYYKDGDKKYVEADLTIDGATIRSVGIRLKGNSTLMGLTWKGKSKQNNRGGGGGLPEGFQPPQNGQAPPNGRPGQNRQGGFGVSLKAEEPEKLPWLISFDEFVKGRRYQGRSQIAVRPAAMQSATLLNEALGISTVGAAGEPTQRFTYSSFTVNGRSGGTRLLVEYLDEGYAEDLGNGVLYKSLASGSFSYKGEDQTKYTEDYKQVNKIGGKDLQPVIDLMKWVEKSSDKEFDEGLAGRVDVESFARYLALQNLMVNFDDMAGPGRNSYLWYDLDTKKFKIITWDLNFAFSGDAKTSSTDTVSMSFGPGMQGQPQGRQGQAPQGFPGMPGGNGAPGGMRMGHKLKERFLKSPALKKVYTEQYRDLYRKLVANGSLNQLLESIVQSYTRNDGADTAKIQSEAKSLRTTLDTRTRTLRSEESISK